jgi:hypothetical protein
VPQRRHPTGIGFERPHEIRVVGQGLGHHPDGDVTVDPRQPGRVHGAIAPSAQPLTHPVTPQPKLTRLELPQRLVMDQDPTLQLRQLRRRLQPELAGEDLPMRLVRPQGLHLPAAAVQGQHQLRLERLPHRMFRCQPLQLGRDLRGPPTRQVGIRQQLVGDQAQLPEPLGLRTRPVLVRELRVCTPPPQPQALAQHVRGLGRVALRQACPARRHRTLETGDVKRRVAYLEQVAGRPRHHPRRRPGTLHHPAQARHITAERRRRPRRRRPCEHDLRQPIGRHHVVPVDQQDRRQAALPRPAQTQLNAAVHDAEPTQSPVLEHRHSNVPACQVSTATGLLQSRGKRV